MKKLSLAFLALIFNIFLFSCTPDSIAEDLQTPQACCGEDGDFPPPPPPPPPGGD